MIQLHPTHRSTSARSTTNRIALTGLMLVSAIATSACGSTERTAESVPPATSEQRAQAPAAPSPVTPGTEDVVASLPPRADGERASPNARASAIIDGVPVAVGFGRPSVRGRRVFGELVPWNEVWRAGADEATTIAFGRDVLVEGQPLAAGVYSLFAIPTEGAWTVIFNRQATQWGAYRYDAAQDALRVEVTPIAHPATEQLDIALAADGLHLRWAEVDVPVRIAAAPSAP